MSAVPEAGRMHALQYRFTAHIRDPEHAPIPAGIEDRRMAIYRDLVYANMESFISSNFPVIRSLYNDTEWSALAHDFFREHRCHTPLFPEFAREFLRYLEARQEQDRDDPRGLYKPFLLELAHYEWAELALAIEQTELDGVAHDADGDPVSGIPVVSPLACVLGYRFPVQHIQPDFQPLEPPSEATVLLLVRGRDDQVRFHEINALSALLIERLRENTDLSGEQCLDALLAGRADDEVAALRPAGIALLRELKSFEAILGTRG
jgi:hypothetical protein